MEADTTPTNKKEYARTVPLSTFILLDVATFGIYSLYWMYKQWRLLKKEFDLKVSPFWRSFFSFIWSGVLADEIKILATNKNITTTYNPWIIGISFFLLTAASQLPDPYWLICFFSFVPILPLLRTMNAYYEIEDASLPSKKLNWWQILLVGLGLATLLLGIVGTFFPPESTLM
jgi:hypothetical protein